MNVRQLLDTTSFTFTYLLTDPETREAIIIDPVRDQLERDRQLVQDLGITLRYVLETHRRASAVSSAESLSEHFNAKSVLSRRTPTSYVDLPVDEGDRIAFGHSSLEVRATPGHTPGCLSYISGDQRMAFTGDALLIRSTGRTDLQGSDPENLYQSVHERIFSLPNSTKIYPGHDYRGFCMTTVGEEKLFNPRLSRMTQSEFVAFMEELACKEAAHRVADVSRGCCGADPFALANGEPSFGVL